MRKIILILLLCTFTLQAQQRAAQPCTAVKQVSENFSQRDTEQWRKASDRLISASTVADQTAVTFVSGNSITLTDGFHAEAGSSFKGFIGDCAQGKVEPAQSKLSASPNPVSGQLNLNLENGQIVKVTLVSMDGKIVLDRAVASPDAYQIDTGQYPKGTYLLTVETNIGERHTEKILIQ